MQRLPYFQIMWPKESDRKLIMRTLKLLGQFYKYTKEVLVYYRSSQETFRKVWIWLQSCLKSPVTAIRCKRLMLMYTTASFLLFAPFFRVKHWMQQSDYWVQPRLCKCSYLQNYSYWKCFYIHSYGSYYIRFLVIALRPSKNIQNVCHVLLVLRDCCSF